MLASRPNLGAIGAVDTVGEYGPDTGHVPGGDTAARQAQEGLAPAPVNGSAVTAHSSHGSGVVPPAMRPEVRTAVPRNANFTPLQHFVSSPPATALETPVDRYLRSTPVVVVAVVRNLVLHWSSAGLLAAACAISPMFVPATGVLSLQEYWDRSLTNLLFGLGAGAVFYGLEYVSPKKPEQRAQCRQKLRVDDINAAAKKIWEGLTNLGPVKTADEALAAWKHWSSVKKGASTVASGVQASVLQGLVVGSGKFLISQFPQEVGLRQKVKRFLESSPLRRAIGPRREEPAAVESPIPNGGSRLLNRILYYIGKGAPDTYGKLAATFLNYVVGVGVDVVGVHILAGGQIDIHKAVTAGMIVNAAGALTNAGLQGNLRSTSDESGWTYGQYFTRETGLAIPRAAFYRALCVGAGVPGLVNNGIQFVIGLCCLYMAGKWVSEHHEASAALFLSPTESK